MMSANKEPLYWRTNKAWYVYRKEKNSYSLTDEAPERAKKSFAMWKKLNNLD